MSGLQGKRVTTHHQLNCLTSASKRQIYALLRGPQAATPEQSKSQKAAAARTIPKPATSARPASTGSSARTPPIASSSEMNDRPCSIRSLRALPRRRAAAWQAPESLRVRRAAPTPIIFAIPYRDRGALARPGGRADLSRRERPCGRGTQPGSARPDRARGFRGAVARSLGRAGLFAGGRLLGHGRELQRTPGADGFRPRAYGREHRPARFRRGHRRGARAVHHGHFGDHRTVSDHLRAPRAGGQKRAVGALRRGAGCQQLFADHRPGGRRRHGLAGGRAGGARLAGLGFSLAGVGDPPRFGSHLVGRVQRGLRDALAAPRHRGLQKERVSGHGEPGCGRELARGGDLGSRGIVRDSLVGLVAPRGNIAVRICNLNAKTKKRRVEAMPSLTGTPADLITYMREKIRTHDYEPMGRISEIAIAPSRHWNPDPGDPLAMKWGRLMRFRNQWLPLAQTFDRTVLLAPAPMMDKSGGIGLPDLPDPTWRPDPWTEEETAGRVARPVEKDMARMIPQTLEARAERGPNGGRSEEHTSELQSHSDLVCRLLLEKKKK